MSEASYVPPEPETQIPDIGEKRPSSDAVAGAPANSPRATRARGGLPRSTYLLAALAVVVLLWALWVTKEIRNPSVMRAPIVSVRLEPLVSEYVQAQTHSGTSGDAMARQTGAFMAALDEVLRAKGADGTTVLVAEAVVAGTVPDITEAVRSAVYRKVPVPEPASAVQPRDPARMPAMQTPSALAQAESPAPAPGDPGARVLQPMEDSGNGYAN